MRSVEPCRKEYQALKNIWEANENGLADTPNYKEEEHRIGA